MHDKKYTHIDVQDAIRRSQADIVKKLITQQLDNLYAAGFSGVAIVSGMRAFMASPNLEMFKEMDDREI